MNPFEYFENEAPGCCQDLEHHASIDKEFSTSGFRRYKIEKHHVCPSCGHITELTDEYIKRHSYKKY